MRKYILFTFFVTLTYSVINAQVVSLNQTDLPSSSPTLTQLESMGIETSIAQIGNYNYVVSNNIMAQGNVSIKQEGKINLAAITLVAPKVNYQLTQFGNNNMLIDVGVSLRGPINRNIMQYGRGSTINIQGSNEMIDNMTIISRGSQNVYIRGLNY
tara:strand:- start:2009 stop:2476 length:468 start_codon:yes stop_codon:yes gene_type:complete